MKHFYTSNYDRFGADPKAVAISHPRDVPENYTGIKFADLAPTEDMLEEYHDRKISHDEYAVQYGALLSSRGLHAAELAEKFDDGTIFLCFDYEDGDISICHRVILAELLNDTGVASVTEI
jgi:uncharacterized protein YeaO (DUF488 family)